MARPGTESTHLWERVSECSVALWLEVSQCPCSLLQSLLMHSSNDSNGYGGTVLRLQWALIVQLVLRLVLVASE